MNAQGDPRSTDGSTSLEKRDLAAVEAAILQAVAYSDVFDYPLTAAEIHRYLVGVRASWRTVRGFLDHWRPLSGRLAFQDGYFLIPGREDIVDIRLRRAQESAEIWPRARRYGAAIGQIPFVRMVAVTGALAMDNAEPHTDIDYLVITEPGRLWLCRALVVALVRLASRRGDVICPNYLLSERTLALGEPNIFTAHELVQMVPIRGLETYQRMCRLNSWAAGFLPNAFDAPRRISAGGGKDHIPSQDGDSRGRPFYWNVTEAVLRTSVGARLEEWEMRRKVRKLSLKADLRAGEDAAEGADSVEEICFSADRCKGHFDNHRRRTINAYSERLRSLAVAFPQAATSPVDSVAEVRGDA
jgi:hypothetical protein